MLAGKKAAASKLKCRISNQESLLEMFWHLKMCDVSFLCPYKAETKHNQSRATLQGQLLTSKYLRATDPTGIYCPLLSVTDRRGISFCTHNSRKVQLNSMWVRLSSEASEERFVKCQTCCHL